MEKEIRKDIEGYEGLYKFSNRGNVKSLERTVWDSRGYYRTVHERILKPGKDRYGYLYVILCKGGIKKTHYVHRLVATAFCENQEGYTEVNHINEDKSDNRADNLEWCSRQYNVEYSKAKAIIGINKISREILEFPSTMEAERKLGIAHGNICACCNGKRNSAGGFYWMYKNNNDDTE